MHLSSMVILTLGVTFGQSLTIHNFNKDLLCDTGKRLISGCSRKVTKARSLIHCVALCGQDDSCIGAGLNENGICILHQECHDVRFCIKKSTTHHYMSKYCKTWNTSTDFCTMCIHPDCYAQTCTEMKRRGYTTDGFQTVDPDGPGEDTQNPQDVYCDMTSKDGVGVSVIGHSRKHHVFIKGYEDYLSYQAVLTYNMSFQQIISLVDKSQNCNQYISFKCLHCHMGMYPNRDKYTGWLNRTMQLSNYFGDATPGSYSCKCGLTGTCYGPEQLCNCNYDTPIWATDDGYLTYKNDLPVYAFVAGDTGHNVEKAYFYVGPLQCWGSV